MCKYPVLFAFFALAACEAEPPPTAEELAMRRLLEQIKQEADKPSAPLVLETDGEKVAIPAPAGAVAVTPDKDLLYPWVLEFKENQGLMRETGAKFLQMYVFPADSPYSNESCNPIGRVRSCTRWTVIPMLSRYCYVAEGGMWAAGEAVEGQPRQLRETVLTEFINTRKQGMRQSPTHSANHTDTVSFYEGRNYLVYGRGGGYMAKPSADAVMAVKGTLLQASCFSVDGLQTVGLGAVSQQSRAADVLQQWVLQIKAANGEAADVAQP